MFGVEFALDELINAFVGGAIGGAVAIAVAWRQSRELREQVAALANYLEWDRESGKGPEFIRDKHENVESTKGHGETTAGGGMDIRHRTEEEVREAGHEPPDPWAEDG